MFLCISMSLTILFLLLIYTYKFMEPIKISEKIPSSTSQTIESTNMYDLMKTNEDIALSSVEELLTHFKIWKIIKNHMVLSKLCKNLDFFEIKICLVSMFQIMFWILEPSQKVVGTYLSLSSRDNQHTLKVKKDSKLKFLAEIKNWNWTKTNVLKNLRTRTKCSF